MSEASLILYPRNESMSVYIQYPVLTHFCNKFMYIFLDLQINVLQLLSTDTLQCLFLLFLSSNCRASLLYLMSSLFQ